MALGTVIKIKNSGTNGAPTALATGELAYSYIVGAQNNGGDRLYVGTGTETSGEAANIEVIGGKYFTDMLDHVHGTLTASSGVIVDANKKINEWLVDNIVLDGNTISINQTSDTNGNLIIAPGGTGELVINGNTTITGTFDVVGNQVFTGNMEITGTLDVDGQTTLASVNVEDLTATRLVYVGTDGELVDNAGMTFDGSTLQLTGNINVDTQATLASANIEDLTDNRIVIVGASGELEDDSNFTFDGTTFKVGTTTTDKFQVAVATGNTSIAGTLDVDSQTTLASVNVEDLTNNRILIAGTSGEIEDDSNFVFDGTNFKVGTQTTDKFVVNVASGNTTIEGTLTVEGSVDFDSQVTVSSLNVEDLTATRVVFAGTDGELIDDSNFTFDNVNDTLNITGALNVDNINVDGNTITASNSNGSLILTPDGLGVVDVNTNTALRIPVGTTGQRNAYTAATGDLRYNTDLSSFEGFDGNNWSGLGGVIDNDRNTYIVTDDNMGGLNVPASPAADTLYFVTGGQLQGEVDSANGWTLNNVNIDDNTISTTSGNLFLDPGQTGPSSPTGDVVIYGNLQVMGTTTQVNSTTVTVDDPIFTLGGDTAPTADDNKDRGIEFRWHDGVTDKIGFFGYDDSAERFTFIQDASNTAEVFSGSPSDVQFGNALVDSVTFTATNFTANSVPFVDGNGDVGFLEETASDFGTTGQVLQMDNSGVPFFGHIDCGTY